MKIKLIDVYTCSREVQFGTCELCFSYGTVDEPVYHFQKDNGETFRVEGYYWCWGDYDELYVDNAILFAEFIYNQEYADDTEFDYNWLSDQLEKYYAGKDETDD